jgi:hypothetical protein
MYARIGGILGMHGAGRTIYHLAVDPNLAETSSSANALGGPLPSTTPSSRLL